MKPKEIITQALLKDLFDYDTEIGIFTRLTINNSKQKIGEVAGGKDDKGYIRIKINLVKFKAHRLAWTYMYGFIPDGLTIDHKNGIRDDNRIENLRLATKAQQCQNITIYSSNKSGYVGVCFHKATGKWQANITINKKQLYLGLFDTPEEAYKVRELKKVELHTFNPIQRITQ